MADSYRLAVLKRLTTLLETIEVTPFEGLTLPTTLEGLVFRGRQRFGDNDPNTMLSLLEDPRPSDYDTEEDSRRLETWKLLLQGWAPDAKDHPSDALYSLANDCELKLDRVVAEFSNGAGPKYPDDYLLGASLDDDGTLIADFKWSPPVVRPASEGISSRCFFYMPLRVGLTRIRP